MPPAGFLPGVNLFLIILYVNCYCGMVGIGPTAAMMSLPGEDALLECATQDVET
jgi:hypothetical protein